MRNKTSFAGWIFGMLVVSPWVITIQPAMSQTPPPAGGQSSDDIQEIVVTTRVLRTGFTAPTPTTTIDASQISDSGASNIADVLNLDPALRPAITSTTSDNRPFAPGANFADLRGLGSTRTLVLINGERVVPEVPPYSNQITNQVDLSIIPTIAIQRVDVITGGASAAWGSDAVAGVVNLNLYRHYQGGVVSISGGESQAQDNRDVNLGFLGGTDFGGGRGHITAAAEFDKNNGIGDVYSRSWGRVGAFTLANPDLACKGCYVAGTGYQYSTYAPGGLITSGPLKGTGFGAAGQPYPFTYGSFISGNGMFGGGVPGNSPQQGFYMEPPSTKDSIYIYSDYQLTDDLTAHVQFDWAESDTRTKAGTYTPTFNIASGNPFIPASVQAAMTADQLSSITVGDYATDIGRLGLHVSDVTNRATVGLDWDLGHTWKVSGYYEFGENYDQADFSNVINSANVTQAANAVTVNGQITCANPANKCAPLDIFGLGSASPAALAFITANAFDHIRYEQQVVAADLHGDPFSTWAGTVSLAAGVSERYEQQTDVVDAAQAAGDYKSPSGSPNALANPSFHGSEHVSEEYGEVVVPLAKDLPGIKELDLNAAARHADYSTAGGANTWKLGVTWNVTEDFLLRATESHDFRAPDLTELYYPQVLAGTIPVLGQSQLAPNYNGGNPNLQPEKAQSTTAGFTFSPQAVPGLHASIDYFNINLKNAITISNGTTIVNLCAAGYTVYCEQETRENGIVTSVHAEFANISSILTRGEDLELSYTTPLSRLTQSLPGAVTFRALGTYTSLLTLQQGPGQPTYNHAGQLNSGLYTLSNFFAPRLHSTFSFNYEVSGVAATLVADLVSAGVADTSISTAQYSQNNIPTYIEYDLWGSYTLPSNKNFQVFATIDNLLNKSPPFDPITPLSIPTAAGLYDIIGRTFKIGVRYKF
jgi:iron complex outermembrane receptor protein